MIHVLKKLIKDKRGDGIMIFIIFLVFLFGTMVVHYTEVTKASIMRQKIYNAVQDGLTLARDEALKARHNQLVFYKATAEKLIKKSLKNNNLQARELNTWYSGGYIRAKGRTKEGTPFNYKIQAHPNFH